MTKNANFVSHKKSKQKNQDGSPKLPLASALVEGEIAINFGKDVETLSIKNESGDVVTFSSDNYYTEQKLGSGFTSANSGRTVTDVIGSGFTSSSITDVIIENEEIVSAALTDLDERKLDASAYTPTDLSNYYTKSQTSGATQISTALAGKVNSATFTGHTADTAAHFTSGEKTAWNSFSASTEASINGLSGQSETIAAALVDLNENKVDTATFTAHTADTDIHLSETDKLIRDTLIRRTRKTSFSLSDLKNAVADQSLEKYGLKVGDETTINGYRYVIAGLNTMKGIYEPYRVNSNHVGLIVIPSATHAWNVSGNTYKSEYTHSSSDGSWTLGAAAGYANCDLHYYLTHTILDHVKADLSGGTANGVLYQHKKLLSNSVNTSGYNRFGIANGCTNSWAWYDEYISALSEIQVYGSTVWSSSGYDTGEACRQLDVFRVYNMNEIFGLEYPWLRDVSSASSACHVNTRGAAYDAYAGATYSVAALILFG